MISNVSFQFILYFTPNLIIVFRSISIFVHFQLLRYIYIIFHFRRTKRMKKFVSVFLVLLRSTLGFIFLGMLASLSALLTKKIKTGVDVHAYSLSIGEAEAGRSQVQSHPGTIYSKSNMRECWRGGPMFKNSWYCCRGPEFSSQHPH